MQSGEETRPKATSPLWRNRDYMWLWSGQVVSTLGSTAATIISLLILALTGSPEAAGIAGALRTIPYLVLSLPVGALIDRWDRKAVMIRCAAIALDLATDCRGRSAERIRDRAH